eukprot:1213754-Pleurochrysis_carterae.AAC.1
MQRKQRATFEREANGVARGRTRRARGCTRLRARDMQERECTSVAHCNGNGVYVGSAAANSQRNEQLQLKGGGDEGYGVRRRVCRISVERGGRGKGEGGSNVKLSRAQAE